LPGHPFLYGTTRLFLEHFGLRSLDEIRTLAPFVTAEQLAQKEQVQKQKSETKVENTSESQKASNTDANITGSGANSDEKKTDASSNKAT
jgi:hypothetical protein